MVECGGVVLDDVDDMCGMRMDASGGAVLDAVDDRLDVMIDACSGDAYIIFQKGGDNFEIEHKTCYFGVRRCSSPLHRFVLFFCFVCLFVFCLIYI